VTNLVKLYTLLSLVLVAAACSGRSAQPPATTAAAPPPVTHTAAGGADQVRTQLLAAVRVVIDQHHRLSLRVLWTNVVPERPAAVAGPALANLRRAAAGRRRQGIRVRLLSERFRIISIRLDPSYARATAVVSDPQQVRPTGAGGRPLGRPIVLNEHARIQLRRVGRPQRFVVWSVQAVR